MVQKPKEVVAMMHLASPNTLQSEEYAVVSVSKRICACSATGSVPSDTLQCLLEAICMVDTLRCDAWHLDPTDVVPKQGTVRLSMISHACLPQDVDNNAERIGLSILPACDLSDALAVLAHPCTGTFSMWQSSICTSDSSRTICLWR